MILGPQRSRRTRPISASTPRHASSSNGRPASGRIDLDLADRVQESGCGGPTGFGLVDARGSNDRHAVARRQQLDRPAEVRRAIAEVRTEPDVGAGSPGTAAVAHPSDRLHRHVVRCRGSPRRRACGRSRPRASTRSRPNTARATASASALHQHERRDPTTTSRAASTTLAVVDRGVKIVVVAAAPPTRPGRPRTPAALRARRGSHRGARWPGSRSGRCARRSSLDAPRPSAASRRARAVRDLPEVPRRDRPSDPAGATRGPSTASNGTGFAAQVLVRPRRSHRVQPGARAPRREPTTTGRQHDAAERRVVDPVVHRRRGRADRQPG